VNAKASTAPGMSGVNPGKRFPIVRLQKHFGSLCARCSVTEVSCKSRGIADSSASLVGGLVSMARGIGTTFGISLMALAWHLGTQSSQAGNPGYPGSEQARPAFAVVAAAAATIALASRPQARPAKRPREADPSGADQ